MLRMRDKATIRYLNLTKEQLATLEKIQQSTNTVHRKQTLIKDILQTNLFCICSEIPQLQVRYDIGGATRMEMYCESCAAKVYTRTKDEPTNSLELAEKWGCISGEQPKTPPSE